MNNEFIGRPKGFHYMEGNEELNFRKTFDLNGTQNDEMLRLYLRKAGLSDEIERLTIEQRRAFIYDIIKSNKMPGYWMPSTMKNSPKTPTSISTISTSLIDERKNQNTRRPSNFATIRSSVSCGSLQILNDANLPQRFIPAPVTPPTPSTFVTSRRGIQYEISGPISFQHTAGDMNRDMTRNAFDLSSSNNDNVLRKYMIERGISEDDVAGMRKTDLIRKIVQSKFTWMPAKKKNSKNTDNPTTDLRINYATISGYPEHRRSRAPLNINPTTPNKPNPKIDFSNYTLVTSRFAGRKEFSSTDEVNNENSKSESKVSVIELPPLPPGTQLPEPPPRKSQFSSASLPTIKKNVPPQPLVMAVKPKRLNGNDRIQNVEGYDNNFTFDPMHSMKPMKKSNEYEPLYTSIPPQSTPKRNRTPPPTPPKPFIVAKSFPSFSPKAGIGRIPLASPSSNHRVPLPNFNNSNSGNTNGFIPLAPPPPPPQPPVASMHSVHSAPQLIHQIEPKKAIQNNNDDNSRDALLESIKKGVTLKKIDQKAATISGIKPRNERRPQVLDFLTELKMGVTSRRMKNPDDNPFTSNENSEWDV